ncbi:hypothetical protein C0Q70_04149 [Pomacea canaliculata]|uniref:Uncharacterized protein n=1 Tax=Pomacea canaliculata TaxID=400727 RepID=A0A2T7PUQ0_POMCA|nr:hypothetical protein C0Q70_04149 [Pomacea canaliculata]
MLQEAHPPVGTDGYDDNKGTNGKRDLSVHPSLLQTAPLPSLFADRSGQEIAIKCSSERVLQAVVADLGLEKAF